MGNARRFPLGIATLSFREPKTRGWIAVRTRDPTCYTAAIPIHREVRLKPAVFYRIASVLLLLFAALHTFGFRQIDPKWRVESVIGSMRSIRFDIMGTSRTYW